jgi:hypothetical protein
MRSYRIEGPANLRPITCAPSDRQRRYPRHLGHERLGEACVFSDPACGSPCVGFYWRISFRGERIFRVRIGSRSSGKGTFLRASEAPKS